MRFHLYYNTFYLSMFIDQNDSIRIELESRRQTTRVLYMPHTATAASWTQLNTKTKLHLFSICEIVLTNKTTTRADSGHSTFVCLLFGGREEEANTNYTYLWMPKWTNRLFYTFSICCVLYNHKPHYTITNVTIEISTYFWCFGANPANTKLVISVATN